MKSEILKRAKGVRDFAPKEKKARDKIVKTLRQVFESFGYNPIETPIIERYDLFASKFGPGQESDAMKESFKLQDQGGRDLVLRTEFTVPFARYVGMNPNMKMPFKRYQIGQVFRDGPVKLGRYREFWQADIDMVGVKSTNADAEILQLIYEVFEKLDLEITISLNNRKVINSILKYAGLTEDLFATTIITLDKLEKMGQSKVIEELKAKGLKEDQVETIIKTINIQGSNREKISNLREILGDDSGLDELERTIKGVLNNESIEFIPSLARGLDYYTGNIFEVFLKDQSELDSSLAGGGRYDKMISGFLNSKKEYPAIGVGFGLETVFEAMKLNKKIVQDEKAVAQVYFVPFEKKYYFRALEAASELRKAGLNTDINLSEKKIKQALDFANAYNIPYVVLIGEDEDKQKKYSLKNMKTGEQDLLTLNQILEKINK